MMHLFLIFFALLQNSFSNEVRYRDWKLETALIPTSYIHSQSGPIGEISGSQNLQMFYQYNLARRFEKFKLDVNYRSSNMKIKIEDKTYQASPENLHFGVLWKSFILRLERVSTPYVVVDAFETKFANIKADWLGLGYRYRIKHTRWRLGGVFSIPLIMRSHKEDNLQGHQVFAWIERWGDFGNHKFLRKMRWKIQMFHERRNWTFQRDQLPGTSKVNPVHSGLAFSLAYVF
jgi:hypothetical protein